MYLPISLQLFFTEHFRNTSIPFFYKIWLYMGISSVYEKFTPTSILWKPTDRFYSILPLTFMNWVSYEFPPKLIWSHSILPEFDHVDDWAPLPSLISLVSTNSISLFCTDPCSSHTVMYSYTFNFYWVSPFINIYLHLCTVSYDYHHLYPVFSLPLYVF